MNNLIELPYSPISLEKKRLMPGTHAIPGEKSAM